ncbi:unnamed protein product, partial [Pylaiella littoralis]
MSRATFGGGGGGSDSDGGNDGDDGGGDPSSSGGGDTDGEGDISSRGSGGNSGGTDSSSDDSGGTDSSSDDSDSGGGGGRGRGGGGSSRGSNRGGRGGGGSSRGSSRGGRGSSNPAKRHTSRHEASDTERIAAKRAQSDKTTKSRAKTVDTAKRTEYGVGTVPRLAKMLTGLTKEPNNGDLLIKDGVYFDHDRLKELESDFNTAYMFNPIHIGVTLNKTNVGNGGREPTKVESGGRELVVESFNDGKYMLEDGTEIGQWELLEKRCDGGVTLDDECRRFVGYKVSTYVSMMARGVPFERAGKNMSGVGMLWNVDDAIAKIETGGFDLDEGDMNLQQLRALKERLIERRTLILRVFTGLSVEDTLP